MSDLPDELRNVLRDRADDAPATPAPDPSLVRRVRRRQAVRMTLAVGGATCAVAGVVAVTAVAVRPAPTAVSPVSPAVPTTAPPLTDDRYEFCTGQPMTDVAVTVHPTELKFAYGCYRAVAGPLRLSFTNSTKVAHNVVVHDPADVAFAKTETIRAAGTAKAGYDSIDLGTLKSGDYSLTCDVHPQMHAQLVVR
jgi:plastocyanin